MASFTGVGDNVELKVANKGESIDVDISGTYAMTIELQVEQGSPGSGSWALETSYSTANATVADKYVTMNGTTTGGLLGDMITITDIASGKFHVQAMLSATGTEVTPFSAAV